MASSDGPWYASLPFLWLYTPGSFRPKYAGDKSRTEANPRKIHNTTETRGLMSKLYDPQMANIADFDCFSQVIFHNVDDYKKMKEDEVYKATLVDDHEKFADTRRSMMTIGWVTEFIRDGVEVNAAKEG